MIGRGERVISRSCQIRALLLGKIKKLKGGEWGGEQ